MRRIFIFCFIHLCVLNLYAQMTLEEVNYRLDTQPYFDIVLESDSNIVLPDSVRVKMINALRRILPQHFADSVFTQPEDVIKNIEAYAWRRCGNDTICFEKAFAERYAINIQNIKNSFYNRCHSRSLILAFGNWNITKAIPYLKQELYNERCSRRHIYVEMALAKLDDSIKQVLLERYTLSYVLANSQLDTINDNRMIESEEWTRIWSVQEGVEVAMYLRSKEMLLNILDLIHIRGMGQLCLGWECIDLPYVHSFIDDFVLFNNHFRGFPNFEVLWEIADDYSSAIWGLSGRNNRRSQRELERLLSTEHRTKVKNQIRDWIIENVSFEETRQ